MRKFKTIIDSKVKRKDPSKTFKSLIKFTVTLSIITLIIEILFYILIKDEAGQGSIT